jgi:hypothetical protein
MGVAGFNQEPAMGSRTPERTVAVIGALIVAV